MSAPPDPAPAQPTGEPAGIDDVLNGLEAAVAQLDSGELPLEQALAVFERGIRLARQGESMLRGVEERIEVLLADGEGTEPFDTHGQPEAKDDSK